MLESSQFTFDVFSGIGVLAILPTGWLPGGLVRVERVKAGVNGSARKFGRELKKGAEPFPSNQVYALSALWDTSELGVDHKVV